jgi:hypothetical protein
MAFPTATIVKPAPTQGPEQVQPPAASGGGGGDVFSQVANKVKEMVMGVVNAFKEGFQQMKSIVMETVGAFRPFEIEKFGRAVKDLQAVFGEIFLPILQKVTVTVRQIADFFYSLPDSFKSMIRVGAEIILVIGGIVTAITAIAAAAAPFVAFGGVLFQVVGIATVGVAIFSRTANAFKLFTDAIAFGERAIMYVYNSVVGLFKGLEAALGGPLNELGGAFDELLVAIEPLARGFIDLVVDGIVMAFSIAIPVIKAFIEAITWMVKQIADMAKFLGATFELDAFPAQGGAKKSAFGLGQHGGSVTDPLSAAKRIQEQIFKNAGSGKETPESNIKQTADNTKRTADILDDMNKKNKKPADDMNMAPFFFPQFIP